jgi:hypothetical protein
MSSSFWLDDTNVLLNKEHIGELFPTSQMSYEQKMNAISRMVIFLTVLGFATTRSFYILSVGIFTLIAIIVLYKWKEKKEGFLNSENAQIKLDSSTLPSFLETEFKNGDLKNPFSNVLLPQIMDEPERKSAPPAFNPDVDETIMENVKKTIQHLNPGIKNTNKQLFSSLTDNFDLEQSIRPFYSTPNTKIANDMNAFAEWCYQDLKYSGKESTPEGAIARVADAYRYTLY